MTKRGETGNGIFSMAASKLQIRLSEHVHRITTKFQRLVGYTHVLKSTYLVGIVAMLSDQTGRTGSGKSKTVSVKFLYLTLSDNNKIPAG